MSAHKCPFKLERDSAGESERKDMYFSYDVPLLDGEDEPKISKKFKILDSSHPEDYLALMKEFDRIAAALDVEDPQPKFLLIETMIGGTCLDDWIECREELDDEDAFEDCQELFLLTAMTRDVAADTAEWFTQLKKPKSMSVKGFFQRVKYLNSFMRFMPAPVPGEARLPSLTRDQLLKVLKSACPQSWKDTMATANITSLTLNENIDYYEGLRNMEMKQEAKKTKPNDSKNDNNQGNGNSKKKGKNKRGGRGRGNGNNNGSTLDGDAQGECFSIQSGMIELDEVIQMGINSFKSNLYASRIPDKYAPWIVDG